MKNISFFLSENVQFLEVKFSIYLNRRVFVMKSIRKPVEQESEQNAVLCCRERHEEVLSCLIHDRTNLRSEGLGNTHS